MYTAGTFPPLASPSVLMSHTSWRSSYAVTVSLARDSGPPQVLLTPLWIVSGSAPDFHESPPLTLTSYPMSEAPPSYTRPTCWVATIVDLFFRLPARAGFFQA